jgi:hypothetical protein
VAVDSEPDPRQAAVRLLIHGILGDSWGVQDSLMHDGNPGPGFVDGFVPQYKLAWQIGVVLRAHMTENQRNALVQSLRQEIVNVEKILGTDW